MKFLLCSPVSLTRAKGGAKIYIELAQGLRDVGHTCDLRGLDVYKSAGETNGQTGEAKRKIFARGLRRYLMREAAEYDVVKYGNNYLPFPREIFPARPLFAVHTPILYHHQVGISYPLWRGLGSMGKAAARAWMRRMRWKPGRESSQVSFANYVSTLRKRGGAAVKSIIHRRRDRRELEFSISKVQQTIHQTDLVSVNNEYDREELIRWGITPSKISVTPLGLPEDTLGAFARHAQENPPDVPTVAFVGSFDFRKGCMDFYDLAKRIAASVPRVQFRLLGTKSIFRRKEVLAHFPPDLHNRVRVIPSFEPSELPELLSDCSIGVFPSYLEGFGFGVLEMLAASLPVVAYDVPGPPEMLPRRLLVRPGDTEAMAEEAASLLLSEVRLRKARRKAQKNAASFTWRRTAEVFATSCKRRIADRSN